MNDEYIPKRAVSPKRVNPGCSEAEPWGDARDVEAELWGDARDVEAEPWREIPTITTNKR